MASSGSSPWIWSQEHNDYYCTTEDASGNITYLWASQSGQATAGASSSDKDLRPRVDSSSTPNPDSNVALMPDPVPDEIRYSLFEMIPGTPERGWYEPLDSSYRMRSGAEIYTFFQVGKVFAMLHTQAASENALRANNDSVTVVKYGEHVFSQIRRFVIVEVRRGFVYACPITTYNGRATTKPGCTPSEHSIVHLQGQTPTLLYGEFLTKDPICVVPVDRSITMGMASRLHYSKVYPIEMNVKVKDIGGVAPPDISKLLRYYREENQL